MSKFDGMTDNEVVQTIYDAIDHVRRRSVASRETDPLWQRINDLEIDNKALLERFDEAVRKLAALDLLSDGTPREVRRLKSENGGLRGALHQQTTYANQLEQEKAAGWAGRDKIDEATMKRFAAEMDVLRNQRDDALDKLERCTNENSRLVQELNNTRAAHVSAENEAVRIQACLVDSEADNSRLSSELGHSAARNLDLHAECQRKETEHFARIAELETATGRLVWELAEAKNEITDLKDKIENLSGNLTARNEIIRRQPVGLLTQVLDAAVAPYTYALAAQNWDGKLPQNYIPGAALPVLNLPAAPVAK